MIHVPSEKCDSNVPGQDGSCESGGKYTEQASPDGGTGFDKLKNRT